MPQLKELSECPWCQVHLCCGNIREKSPFLLSGQGRESVPVTLNGVGGPSGTSPRQLPSQFSFRKEYEDFADDLSSPYLRSPQEVSVFAHCVLKCSWVLTELLSMD